MTKQKPTTARSVALTALERIRQGAYSNIELDQLLQRAALKDSDRRLATNIVYGVLQHRLTLEYWLHPFVHRKLDSWVETLLWMSIYQYHYLDRVPDWAVTNESIELAKQWGNPRTRKFVTGVLHAILRQGLADLDKITDPIKRLAVQQSVPEWLVKAFVDQYGMPTAQKILTAINQPAHVVIRVNPAVTTLAAVEEALDHQGIEYRPSTIAPDALVITKGEVLSSDLFEQGAITIQDESAMLAVDSMQVQPGDRVLCFEEELPLYADCAPLAYGKESDVNTLSAGLFAALRELDDPSISRVYARCPVGGGVAYAVQNRLKKAAAFHIVDVEAEE